MRRKELKSLVKKIIAESNDNVFQLRPRGSLSTALASADDIQYAIEEANAYLKDLEVLEDRLIELDVLIQLSKESASGFLAAQGALREMRSEALRFVIDEISESKDKIKEVNSALETFEKRALNIKLGRRGMLSVNTALSAFEESAKEVNSTLMGKE